MKKLWCIVGLLLFLTAYAKAEYQKNILVLHSYHQGLMWTDDISRGIAQICEDYPEYELEYLYLNARRTFDQQYLIKQEDIIAHDLVSYNYEAIIVSDNAAFDLLRSLPDSVLPDIPIVCCGINGDSIVPFADNCYIVHETIDFEASFMMISRLLPALDTLLIVNDRSQVGNLVQRELQQALNTFECPFVLDYYDDYNLEALKSKVGQLSSHSAIYLLVFNQDNDGVYISYNYGLRTIVKYSSVPIFGAWDFYLGKGIVGGKLTRGQNHGRVAAAACIKLLQHQTLLKEDLQATNKYRVDYAMMQHYGLKKSALPMHTVFINEPDRQVFVRLFYVLLIVLFIVVIAYRRNRRYLKREVLKRTEDLKLSLNHKDQFFSLLAHDLRSPMGTLSQGLKLLEQNGDRLPEVKKQRMLRELTKTSSRIFYLLEDLLVWGRFQFSSRYEAQLSDFELRLIVNDVCELYYLERDRSLFINKVPTLLTMHNDAFVLKFILRNLISNAIKYSPDNTMITIGADQEDGRVYFWVKDEGQGMSEAVIQSILEQAPIQTQGVKGQKSFGLGLRSVQAYLKQLNGEMKITSTEGEGSCFYIYL